MGLKTIFMGSPDFAVPTLAALIANGHDVVCVYSQPPKPAGRGRQLRKTPVHDFAEAQGIPARTPSTLKSTSEQTAFAELDADIAVVVAYGLILPKAILDATRLGCINLHGSLLPRWRGAAPIQRAVMAGDRETGVQTMQMEAGLDTGPVLMSETIAIEDDDTAGKVHDRLAPLGADLMVRTLAGLERSSIQPKPQAETGATYAEKITLTDRPIDWTRTDREVDCQIRGLSPLPGALFTLPDPDTGETLQIKALMSTRTHVAAHEAPGTVLDERLAVACGEGAVRITRLQRPGRGPVSAEDYLRGRRIPAGTVLG